MKNIFNIMLVLTIILILGGSLSAQSTYVDPPEDPEDSYDISAVSFLQMGLNETLILTASPEPQDSEVSWESSNTAAATVQGLSPRARVTAVGAGTATVTARALTAQADGTFWEESVTIEVISTPTPRTGGTGPGSVVLLSLLAITALPAAYIYYRK